MKKYISLLLAAIAFFSFTACNMEEAKNFTYEELTITLTDAYSAVEREDFAACYESDNTAIFILREDFTTYPDLMDYGPNEYAGLFLETNGKNSETLDIASLDNIPVAEYTYYDEGTQTSFKYFAAFYKSGKAFWVVQFACAEDDYADNKAKFDEFAKSVNVN